MATSPLIYRAVINLDYGDKDNNEYQKLIAALLQGNWSYVETSALQIETMNLAEIWQGLEIIAKQSDAAGKLSALTIHIQGTDSPDGKNYAGANNHPNALDDVLSKPFPRP